MNKTTSNLNLLLELDDFGLEVMVDGLKSALLARPTRRSFA